MTTTASSGTANSPPSETNALAPMTPALRKKLQQCYEHGTRLLQQDAYDFDYAHSLLVECVVADPGNLTYVEAFLENLQRKYRNNKRGALLAFGGKGPFKKCLARQEWAAALRLGPEILKSNPWDVTTLRGMAEACAQCGFNDVELRYLKNALDANPKDANVNRHCALSLARIGQFDQAISCWTRVDEIKRGDAEAQKMIAELQIAKINPRHGPPRSETTRRTTSLVPEQASHVTEEATTTADEPRREFRLTRRQELEQALVLSPGDVDSYLELSQLHLREDRFGEAAQVLERALAASGNDLRIQERIEDVEILRKKQQLQIAERRAAAEENEAHRLLVSQLRDDLNRIELEVFDRRAQRYPTNLEWKYQLGFRLKRAGNLREAKACFEQVLAAPERRAAASLEIGECLQRLKKYDQALGHYRTAVEQSQGESVDVYKLALYRSGVLAAGLGNFDEAENYLERLFALDPQFKDVTTHLDKIRLIRHKQGQVSKPEN